MYAGVLMSYSVHGKRKKVRQVKSKVKSILIIFFDMKGIVHKEFILAGQIVDCDALQLAWSFGI
jgi:hypothetical protein